MLSCASIFSQEALKSTEEEYYDFLSLQGLAERPTLGYRTLSDSEWTLTEEAKNADENVWKNNSLGSKWTVYEPAQKTDNFFTRGIDQSVKVKVYGPEWYNSYNTASPYGQNDGALWQGKGYNTSLTAGARLEAYGLEATFKPQLSFSQNREFDNMLSGVYGSEYSYFWKGNIDLVQRYGYKSFWSYDWGDSEVRYTWHNLTAGAGYQNPWLGPAWLNPMLGSNNSGSYPKVDIGLRKAEIQIPKLNWYIGDVEARIWTGLLTESDYFDANEENDKRMLNAVSLSYAPSFWNGLTIGVNRIFLTKWKTQNLKYLGRLFTLSTSNDVQGEGEDQKVSLFVDQVIPSFGFEVYAELGIDDFSKYKIANPSHTMIYTIGAKKDFSIYKPKGIYGELIFEWNNFEMSQDFQLQWPYMGYYSHSKIVQGYTQNGQILGAGSGYAGNSHFLGFKIYYPKGDAMLFIHRNSPDNNFTYSKAVTTDASADASINGTNKINNEYWGSFKTYMMLGLSTNYYISKNFIVSGSFSGGRIYFPTYVRTSNADQNMDTFFFSLGAKYNF